MATTKRTRRRAHLDERIARHLLVVLSTLLLAYVLALFWYVNR